MSDTLLRCLCPFINGKAPVLAVLRADGRLELRGHGKARTIVGAAEVRCEKCGYAVTLDKAAAVVLA